MPPALDETAAPKERENAAHGASRGEQRTSRNKPRKGRMTGDETQLIRSGAGVSGKSGCQPGGCRRRWEVSL